MNVAYFSTTRATGSSSSYSRFTCCGGLLMMDISSLLSFLFAFNGRGQNTLEAEASFHSLGWSDPKVLLGSRRQPKAGRSSPARCFARVQIDRRAMRNLYAPNNFASPAG